MIVGEEIVQLLSETMSTVNPLVLGSNPSGPTTHAAVWKRWRSLRATQSSGVAPALFAEPPSLADRVSSAGGGDPAQKLFQLDMRSLANLQWKLISAEAIKCRLLCANCHAELHNPDSQLVIDQ